MALRKFLLTAVAVVVLLLAMLAWFYPLADDFRTENPFWNGIRADGSTAPLTPISSLSGVASLPGRPALIVIPYLDFTSPELDELQRFVTRGGTLVIADDYGYGNRILERLGIPTRFSRETLVDPLLNYRNGRLPRIYNLSSSPLLAGVDNLILNHATTLTDAAPADVLAWSSSASFLDLNDNSIWEVTEPAGPLPVISQHAVGDGKVVLISDPSTFINGMRDMDGNDTLVRNLAATTGSRVYLDQAHLPESNLHNAKDILRSVRSYLATPPGTLALLSAVLLASLSPVWYRRRQGPAPSNTPKEATWKPG